MTIERIHTTDRLSRIVKHNGTVYLCGQTAGQEEWDIAEQTRQCLTKIDTLLNEAGSNSDSILSVTIYIRDMKDFAAMNEVWDAWFADRAKPARACVEARMARPIVLVEMSVTAALAD
ncbi:RidA family protein [Marinobacterium lutimaris]|uniref:Enamine deaminase RidA, house cleaning of reactive enamine intermediates, YjgF/YER057c/UK114 family n=1 Tax=Marinobacterium lutimaris TaxID=568106 RepID=A0A1H5TRD5_9GAMM|nr:RidA family protein [Marinobacterium lutimaris]SEF64788.1 Enamine deaminase RidA, house cleaning of reactive enamine intermediates, YjgF/YER057c/UK114 family [Marinobacterium lutimaris]